MLRFAVVTLMPAMFDALGQGGITARAVQQGLVEVRCFNPRDEVHDGHRAVDDRPYGGGPGMVMQAGPLCAATRTARGHFVGDVPTLLLSPQGRRFDQSFARQLAASEGAVLVCGRYEGVDERFVEAEVDDEISLGDFVLSGGEIAAMAVIDAVTRLLPGALGHDESADEDSFERGWLDCPHYTRPEVFDGQRVPAVLLSGNHAEIARWRLKQSLGRTAERRPDLLRALKLTAKQRALLDEYMQDRVAECAAGGGKHK